MVNPAANIFISYCREDTNASVLELYVEEIKKLFSSNVNISFDEMLVAGANLHDFMDNIHESSAILVFLTPEYKNRVVKKMDTGVHYEFSIINAILDNEDNNVPVIPVLLNGDKSTSCPTSLQNMLYADLSSIDISKTHTGFKISKSSRVLFDKELKKVVGAIQAGIIQKSSEFKQRYSKLKTTLFCDRKGENIFLQYKDEDLKNLIVKTKNYKDVLNQGTYILMGRKGSGKSTIINALKTLDSSSYKCFCHVNLEQFSLIRLFNRVSAPQNKSDDGYVIPYMKIFEVAWEIFFSICCINMLKHNAQIDALSEQQLTDCEPLFDYLETVKGQTSEPLFEEFSRDNKLILAESSVFNWVVSKIYEVIDKFIEQEARTDSEANFNHDLETLNEGNKLRNIVLPQSVRMGLEEIAKSCSKKFFISLDGFDTSFEQFRAKYAFEKNGESITLERIDFENSFLASFLHQVIEIKTGNKNSRLFNIVDFCVMVPRDRFLSMRRSERDAYVYRDKYSEISWSGPELAVMLRKRLEALNNYSYKKDGKILPPFEALDQVLRTCYPDIPLYTSTTVSGVEYKKHIFIDVLRHTFWRPRDILYYFAGILSLLDSYATTSSEVNVHAISEVISSITDNVIKDEFLGEFKTYFTNIENVISKFSKSTQIITYSNLKKILDKSTFEFNHAADEQLSLEEKLKLLYEIGFLGVQLPPRLMKKYKMSISDIFFFSYGRYFLDRVINNKELESCNLVIHPIFCEFLDLDTENQSLTLDFDIEYLTKNEQMRAAIK